MSDLVERVVIFLIAGALVSLGVIFHALFTPDYRGQAIERGYALHCPKDGRFAWIGECDE